MSGDACTVAERRDPQARKPQAAGRDPQADEPRRRETDHILGAAILGTEGGELVQILHAVMLAGALTLLKGAICIHPTLAEGFWTLMEEVKLTDLPATGAP